MNSKTSSSHIYMNCVTYFMTDKEDDVDLYCVGSTPFKCIAVDACTMTYFQTPNSVLEKGNLDHFIFIITSIIEVYFKEIAIKQIASISFNGASMICMKAVNPDGSKNLFVLNVHCDNLPCLKQFARVDDDRFIKPISIHEYSIEKLDEFINMASDIENNSKNCYLSDNCFHGKLCDNSCKLSNCPLVSETYRDDLIRDITDNVYKFDVMKKLVMINETIPVPDFVMKAVVLAQMKKLIGNSDMDIINL